VLSSSSSLSDDERSSFSFCNNRGTKLLLSLAGVSATLVVAFPAFGVVGVMDSTR
jgi:hypothetical protein